MMCEYSTLALKEAYLDKLTSSGLTEDDSAKLKFELCSTSPEEIAPKGAGFTIPYFDFDGQPIHFYRYRYLTDPRSQFLKLTKAKPLRYTQPAESGVHAYFPPLIDWARLIVDVTIPLCITEGELKAACATKHGVNTIGLGGVWCFKSTAKKQPMLPELMDIKWKDRVVTIAYDSDAANNPDVAKAQNVLANELTRLGAEVYIAAIPSISATGKTGIDDLIVANGADALKTVLDSAQLFVTAKELRALNEEVVYVKDPGLILKLDTKQRLSCEAFVKHAYSTRVYTLQETTSKGVKLVEKSAASEWLKWPSRLEVERMTYEPGGELITTKRELNTWRGWGVQPAPGDVSPWTTLLDYIFNDEPEARKYFEQWCAYPLQYPGTKLFTCVLLWGRTHGTGKSLIGYSLMRIYGSNGVEIKDSDLHGAFNDWAEGKQFVMGDEITGGDKRAVADRLKSFITQQQLRINQKYVPTYTVPDRINYFFTSNHPDAFYLEDDDRRHFIHEVSGAPLSGSFYRDVYDPWYKSDEGAAALFHHLLTLDLSGFDPRKPALVTSAKLDMTDAGRSDLATWVAALRENPGTVLRVGDNELPYDLWRAEDLVLLYDPERHGRVTVNGLARELRRQGFERLAKGQSIPIDDGSRFCKLWAVRNREKYTDIVARQLGKMYDAERNN